MLAAWQHNFSAGVSEENAEQCERSVHVKVERSGVGDPVNDTNTSTLGITLDILRRLAITWNRKRRDNQD